jgi:hypothetical protein
MSAEKPKNPDWSPTLIDAWGTFDAEGISGIKTIPFHVHKWLNPNAKGMKNAN